MKVVVVMETSPMDGGGFYQALNALLQMQRLCAGRHSFAVVITRMENKAVLDSLGVPWVYIAPSWYERVQPLLLASRLIDQILDRFARPSRLESRLLAQGADLAYFVSPWWSARVFRRLNYWLTVWDLAHLDYPEFPEVRQPYDTRERILQRGLRSAALVLSDSASLSERISSRYGVNTARTLAMPFSPADRVVDGSDAAPDGDCLARLGLQRGYFFYPAQFWAHKNHVRILEALQLCQRQGHNLQVVFAGGDRGLRGYIEALTRTMELQTHVRFLGFVDPGDMRALYLGSRAVVMPTYFGPTNLPPLEAWALGRPLIYSRHLREQAGDAALLTDPDDASELADCMLACLDDARCDDLVARGTRRLQQIQLQRTAAEQVMTQQLAQLEARLRCGAPVTRKAGP